MLLTPFSADAEDERTQGFVKKYKELHGEIPNQFAADGYDAVYVIYEAIQAAGCTADMSAADICEALVKSMTAISVDGLTGQGMTWQSTGEVSKNCRRVRHPLTLRGPSFISSVPGCDGDGGTVYRAPVSGTWPM